MSNPWTQLTKVVVVTRGRTGSSAIVDELGRAPGCRSVQELFASGNYAGSSFPYFVAWRQTVPQLTAVMRDSALASAYLQFLENDTRDGGCQALFWKALTNNFVEHPYLGELLRRQGYRTMYLKREPVRTVLSGMIAKLRGRFNSLTEFTDSTRYTIDLTDFAQHLRYVKHALANDLRTVRNYGLDCFEIEYEDYLRDRVQFFAETYTKLGLPAALPEGTDYQVMIPDLRQTIANYDEVADAVRRMGHTLDA